MAKIAIAITKSMVAHISTSHRVEND